MRVLRELIWADKSIQGAWSRDEGCLRRLSECKSRGRLSECRSRGRLSEWWLSRWSRCISRLKHHRLRKGDLKLNTLWLEWRNVELGFSLLIATLRVYSTLHLSSIYLLLYSGMCLSLFLGLCWYSLYSPNPRTIGGFLKFHLPHRLVIISVISVGGLKVCLFAQVNVNILKHFGKEVVVGKYVSRAFATWDHMHHHQVPQVDSSPNHNRVNEECLIVRDIISVSAPW